MNAVQTPAPACPQAGGASAPANSSSIMRAGILTAAGTLFLRASVYEARSLDGAHVYEFWLLARDGLDQQRYVAHWAGAEAQSFVRAHRERLRPGCALTLTLHRLRCINGEIVASIYSCSLAPDRWQHLHQAGQPGTEEAHE